MEELITESSCLAVDMEELFEDEEENENGEEDDEVGEDDDEIDQEDGEDHGEIDQEDGAICQVTGSEDDDYDDDDEVILYSLANVDKEIQESLDIVDKIQFDDEVEGFDEGDQGVLSFFDADESNEYDLSKGELINDLVINLGTDSLPRFSCASHKCNIALRLAIKNHQFLCKTLAKLTNFAASTKRSINLIKLHAEKKSRLRCENLTRWSSSYLMLESFHKAYMRGVFTNILAQFH